jgi:hypothetical protein
MKRRTQAFSFFDCPRRIQWLCLACLLVWTHKELSAQSSSPYTAPQPKPHSVLLPEANRPLDANQQMELHEQRKKKVNFAAANAERKKQIDEDAAQLLKLAAELKLEMDKTDKDTLSLTVIRKADEMERLAHNVKEKMKLTVGGG